MKKIQVVALSAFVAVGALLTSCGGSVSTDASLKTEMDTISYSFGASLYEQGLSMHLQQLGIVGDTASVSAYYRRQIASDSTAQGKETLAKEMKSKVDSITKANNRNIAEFLKGLQESIKAPESQSAYFAGIAIGNQISQQMLPNLISQMYGPDSKEKVNTDAFVAAMATAMKGGKFAISDPASLFNVKMQEVQAKAQAKQEEELKKQYSAQIDADKKFLDENKAKEGVVTLPDGLQYKVVKMGNGAKPTATDIVKVHYHGTLIDGTVFDSSVERGEPATFNVSGVIKGWTEVLQLMPVGSKWTVYVPYDLAYGAQDRGAIKPFSSLIFDVELLSIETKK
ncbi:FKBP-type peptidyl-prolyl cis-trans isomerase [Dysgonomonas sp. BGC7]|uniref:FKBP-type peptidyl-prolyl cis-trans isomerase n=1 Tax=Dysgonomonas sp. BGC7 TaxID=1658008 RepID=UPI000682583D|nr:FKBP-type peptidyl-prolyl cis-trans isomerase [Dysgonomonas sp. BGC7]MBD8389449.1 FKBP-type peptidyl-prolyl cis-trans isomerase [Dysgonomonas sp. BGC7]